MKAEELSAREVATILAALRQYQRGTYHRLELEEIATNGGEFEALTADEIDELCQRINCGE